MKIPNTVLLAYLPIASHPEPRGLTDVPEEFLFAMQGYATQVSQSNHLEEAATAAAHLGRTCGDCHREQDVEPRFLVGTAPPAPGFSSRAHRRGVVLMAVSQDRSSEYRMT